MYCWKVYLSMQIFLVQFFVTFIVVFESISEDVKSLTKLQERSNPVDTPSAFGKGMYIGGSPGGASFNINNSYAEKVNLKYINLPHICFYSNVTL